MKNDRVFTIIILFIIAIMVPALAEDLPKVAINSVWSVERRAAKVYTGTVLGIGGDSDREFCVVPIFFSKKLIREQVPISEPDIKEIFTNAKQKSEGPFFSIEQMIVIRFGDKEAYILFVDEGGGRFMLFKAEEVGDGVFTQGSRYVETTDGRLKQLFEMK